MLVRGAPENMLCVIKFGPLEPLRAWHLAFHQDGAIWFGCLNMEIFPDRSPEIFYPGHRPLPQLAGALKVQSSAVSQPLHIGCCVGLLLHSFGRLPEECALLDRNRHAVTSLVVSQC